MIQRCARKGGAGVVEELVARCGEDLVACRKESLVAVEPALAADERTRNHPESVVAPEEP